MIIHIKIIKVDAVLIHPAHGDIRFSGTAKKERDVYKRQPINAPHLLYITTQDK